MQEDSAKVQKANQPILTQSPIVAHAKWSMGLLGSPSIPSDQMAKIMNKLVNNEQSIFL